jgi:hypothetical protein
VLLLEAGNPDTKPDIHIPAECVNLLGTEVDWGYFKEYTMGPIVTPFGRHTTATEVVEGIDLSGKRAIVTGAASGIGIETARALARTGAEVTLAVRNTDAGAQTAADITATTGNQNIHVAPLDLSDRNSITSFIAAWDGPLHILVNNAGVMASPEQHTPEGWEMQFATNHQGRKLCLKQ